MSSKSEHPSVAGTAVRRLKRMVKALLPPQYVLAWRAFFTGCQEAAELRYVCGLIDPSKGCIDVGAHESSYTRSFLRCCAEVHCYEPNPEKARFLARAFSGRNVTVYPYAASSRDGRAVLNIPADDANDHSQEATLREMASAGLRIEVETRRLDSMGHRNIGFIKIDVEGHEEEVLDGASDLVARERPILFVEIARLRSGRDPRETFARIIGWGYSGLFLIGSDVLGIDRFVEEDHQNPSHLDEGGLYISNFIFIPL